MQLELAGKSALVTGSSRGIGLGIAQRLSALGCAVTVNGRHRDAVERGAALMPAGPVFTAVGDASDPADAARIVATTLAGAGRLDILVCNVGGGASVVPGQETHPEWQRVFATNLWSATNMVEAASQALETVQGVIVCVSSICGREVIAGAPVPYSAAKAALNAYVRCIARPLGKRGIRINAVAPGNILFDGSVWSRKLAENPEAVEQMLARDVALGRLGTPEDVADCVAWLASPRARFATGAIFTVDGGQIRS